MKELVEIAKLPRYICGEYTDEILAAAEDKAVVTAIFAAYDQSAETKEPVVIESPIGNLKIQATDVTFYSCTGRNRPYVPVVMA